jgi:transglutaminase-like putative cysteine protease
VAFVTLDKVQSPVNAPVPAHLEPSVLHVEPMSSLDRLIALQVPFLAYRGLDWTQVRRTRFFAYQRFQYVYQSLVLDLSQRLMVKPPLTHGDQRLCDFKLAVEPIPLTRSAHTDRFGNRVIKLEIGRINDWTAFEVMFTTERIHGHPGAIVSSQEANLLKGTTPLTTGDAHIIEVAVDLKRRAQTPLELAERISDFVSGAMQYRANVTSVRTTASEALQTGAGLCQDYTHIALALCRASGLSARYVSGHMLGEGGSHAWLEVAIPDGQGKLRAVGFDPTNARKPNLGYVTVAVGRDYRDVPPTSGRFTGESGGRLEFEKHSGLIELEMNDGTVLQSVEQPSSSV